VKTYFVLLLTILWFSSPSTSFAKTRKKVGSTHRQPKNEPVKETLLRFNLALDLNGSKTADDAGSGDLGAHIGLNIKREPIEITLFTGIELALSEPINPYGKSAIAGIECSFNLIEPLHFVFQSALVWNWFNRRDSVGILWYPDTQIPLQAGLEITLFERERTEIVFEVLAGIAPKWSAGAYTTAGTGTLAIHINL
jgi:hypothetical protein